MRWRLVVPVQRAERAKTRLVAPEGVSRPGLARAIAADTLTAVCRALPPRDVLVVTSDPASAALGHDLGARVVPDPGAGLDAAVRAGLEQAQQGEEAHPAGRTTDVGGPEGWAVLLGDLPCLRPDDLLHALDVCARHERAVVPDADGTGTVLLTAVGDPPVPEFGPGSAARHGSTSVVLDLALPRLRRDVDTTGDLREAVALGVGDRTALELATSRPARPSP